MTRIITALTCWTCLWAANVARGQAAESALIEMQKSKLAALAVMDGVWRGTAWMILPTGDRVEMIQTERVGPLLDGAIKTVEGRGYDSQDRLIFNAFGVISFDPAKNQYGMRSYAQGRQGDFVLNVTDDGFSWEIPAGPAQIRYTATVAEGKWHEYGERLLQGREPIRFFEMNLERTGDTTWPADGAVAPR